MLKSTVLVCAFCLSSFTYAATIEFVEQSPNMGRIGFGARIFQNTSLDSDLIAADCVAGNVEFHQSAASGGYTGVTSNPERLLINSGQRQQEVALYNELSENVGKKAVVRAFFQRIQNNFVTMPRWQRPSPRPNLCTTDFGVVEIAFTAYFGYFLKLEFKTEHDYKGLRKNGLNPEDALATPEGRRYALQKGATLVAYSYQDGGNMERSRKRIGKIKNCSLRNYESCDNALYKVYVDFQKNQLKDPTSALELNGYTPGIYYVGKI